MNSEKYWEQRKAREMYEYMEKAEDTAAQIEKAYRKASLYIQEESKKVFEKYQSKYGLSRKSAELLMKKLKSADIEGLKRLLESDPSNDDYKMLLESQAYNARLNRLSNVFNQLDAIVLPMIAEEQKRMSILYEELAKEAYYKSIFDVQQYTGYGFKFKALDEKNIKKVLSSRWSGKNFSQRIWENTNDLAAAVKEELLINLLTGRPLKKAQDSIDEKFQSGASNSRRLVRTESCYICNQLQLQGYEACGIEKYIYLAILDLKTSATCRGLDKKRFPVSEAQAGKNFPPMHPYCRSTTIADMPDRLLKNLKQSALDPKTGKRITVPGDMTYEQWYEKYVKGKEDVIAKEKGLTNKNLDREQFEKYKEIFKNDFPDSIEEFQKLKYNNAKVWERFKAEKQDKLNAMDFSEMQGLVKKLGNLEVRSWYKAHDKQIPGIIDRTLPLKEQAEQACNHRQTYKKQARDLMKNQAERKRLDKERPIQTFEELLIHKRQKYGLRGDDAYRDIIRSSVTTNKEYDIKAGIKHEEK